ncbi:hypothetical protein CF327_g3515 [Tilletia walkeri]|uniref:Uncharacterized protein n=1 Tax=Tilletia walkeri TaxID=117179 RepID=A0A8X7N2H3_9BASI|nr:hypothetical protein CF327_g3515 [Tilletia walkeri]KAE8263387.1 hypothetical protein A4X09_0g7246 [Tilletia walkeri]
MNATKADSSFAMYWRRTDDPNLTIYDRIYWVMQWVFNDPRGELHGGRPATVTTASEELVWIARTFGQEPEPRRMTLDEVIAATRRNYARRAKKLNIHPIGRAIWGGRGLKRRSPKSSVPHKHYEAETEEAIDNPEQASPSSSAAVSEGLQAEEDTSSEKDIRMEDGVSMQTVKNARRFKNQQYVRNNSDSEDSVE